MSRLKQCLTIIENRLNVALKKAGLPSTKLVYEETKEDGLGLVGDIPMGEGEYVEYCERDFSLNTSGFEKHWAALLFEIKWDICVLIARRQDPDIERGGWMQNILDYNFCDQTVTLPFDECITEDGKGISMRKIKALINIKIEKGEISLWRGADAGIKSGLEKIKEDTIYQFDLDISPLSIEERNLLEGENEELSAATTQALIDKSFISNRNQTSDSATTSLGFGKQ